MEDTLNNGDALFKFISVVDSSVVWAAGSAWSNSEKLIYKRNSSGVWTSVPLNGLPVNEQFSCLAAINSQTAFVGIGYGNAVLYRTTNSGLDWQIQINTGGSYGYFNDIRFSRNNPSYGYAWSDPPSGNGTPFKIYKTSNYGDNWTLFNVIVNSNYIGASPSICVTDSNHAWFGLNKNLGGYDYGKILYTSNGGINFSVLSLSLLGAFVQAVEFKKDNLLGFSVMNEQSNYYSKTDNGGINWYSVSSNYNFATSIGIISIPNSNVWYAANKDLNTNKILKSTNDGNTWFPMQMPSGQYVVRFIDGLLMNNKAFAFAVSLDGHVLRLVDTVSLLGVPNNNSQFPDKYSLLQNYPNPFNPVTTIEYNLPIKSFVHITVFDILGREVMVLVNETRNAGFHSIQFNAEQYASGIYLYKMISDNFIDVKKMILIK